MEAIDELSQLSDSMKQAASLLADEDPDETSSSRRPSTFLNVVALGNMVSALLSLPAPRFVRVKACVAYFLCSSVSVRCDFVDLLDLD